MSPVSEKHARSTSLRQIAIIGVGLGILLPAILLGSWMLKARHDNERAFYLQTLATQYTDMLAQAAATPLWNVDKEGVTSLAEALMRNPDVVVVRVEEPQEGIFVERKADVETDERGLHVVRRLVVYNGDPIGTATVAMDLRTIDARLQQEMLTALGTLAAQVVLSVALVFFLLNRRVIRPIVKLKRDAIRLARGELDEPLEWQRDDEIGLLAGGLDCMRQDLRELITEIDHKNQELQQQLNERIAAEKALRYAEEKLRTLFNASPIAISVTRYGDEFTLLEVNDQWSRQYGLTREEAVGKTGTGLGLWVDPEDRRRLIEMVDSTGEVNGFEAWLRTRKDEAPFLCRFIGRTIQYGDESLLMVSQQDVTADYRHEQEMLQLNQLLEQRVQERTEALSKSNQDLRSAVKNLEQAQAELLQREKLAALGALVAGIAHELNTPIGNSVTAASTLHEQAAEFSRQVAAGITRSALDRFLENTNTASDIVLRNLSRAAELVSSFKRVAVDQTSDQRRTFDLAEVINETLLTLGPGIKQSGHEVTHDISLHVLMDSFPGALSQVISNLINNALVHAFADKAHGAVRVTAEALEDGNIRLVVSDDGCGIASENPASPAKTSAASSTPSSPPGWAAGAAGSACISPTTWSPACSVGRSAPKAPQGPAPASSSPSPSTHQSALPPRPDLDDARQKLTDGVKRKTRRKARFY